MRSILWLLGMIAVIFASPIHAAEEARLTWLFVMTGEVESAGPSEIVIKAHPTVVAFTDRPDRVVKTVSLETFVDDMWKAGTDSFENDPPNAALVFGDTQVAIEELKSVRRNGGTISFSTVELDGILPKSGDQVAIVIDIF